MITHVVLFRMAEGSEPAELVSRLRALPDQIREIRSYHAGVDVVHGPTSYDVGLVSGFADLDALEAYRRHPAHQEVLEWIGVHTTDRVAVDFEA